MSLLNERKTLQLATDVFLDADPEMEYVQLRIGDGDKKYKIRKVDLHAALYVLADEKTRDDLMPVRTTEVLTFERIHNVQLKKDMKKGSIMKVRCHIDAPVRIEENLRGMLKEGVGKKQLGIG